MCMQGTTAKRTKVKGFHYLINCKVGSREYSRCVIQQRVYTVREELQGLCWERLDTF